MTAKQLDDNKIVMGQMVRVANLQKKFNENEQYIAIQVEDENGKNERCLLFTEIELSDMEKINFKFAFDNMKSGRLYSATIDRKPTYLVKLSNDNEKEMIYRISPTQLTAAEERAKRNPEDLTKKSWFTNLKD